MNRDKEVSKVVSEKISLVKSQYSYLVELLGVLTVMLAQITLVKKRLLALTPKCKMGRREADAHHLTSV